MRKYLTILVASAISCAALARAEEPTKASPELIATITRMDKTLNDAFNSHDATRLMELFAEELEFYQDNEGLQNFAQTSLDFHTLLAQNPTIRRELIPGSLQIVPIKNFGAVEIGEHRFCTDEKQKEGPPKTQCGNFKFVHVWRQIG